MRSLILTGSLATGKTTAQRVLVNAHGFWTPRTITTRPVELDETEVVHVTEAAFRAGVVDGRFVLPVTFGGNWYAWPRDEVTRLSESAGPAAVLNVRPYTALVVAGLVPSMLPVWLWTDEKELHARRAKRGAIRDSDGTIARLRQMHDLEDRAYEPLFAHRIRSDENTVSALLDLQQRESRP